MRYTEVRMSKIAHELLADIDKETVDFVENYDGSNRAVGHADAAAEPAGQWLIRHCRWYGDQYPAAQPHRSVDAALALIEDPASMCRAHGAHSRARFSDGRHHQRCAGIYSAYRPAAAGLYSRRTEVEPFGKRGREAIIVTELPFQVNKARLIEKIAELVRDKRIEGISELRDESDKDGMRIVIELRRARSADVVLNNLYKQTSMQSVFGINMVALLDGQPKLLNLKQVLEAFLATVAKSSPGEPFSICAKRATAPTSLKGRRSLWRISTRLSR